MLGNFHSHPASPSRPSEDDKRLAFDPEASSLIMSLMDEQSIVFQSFNVIKNEVIEEKLIVEGE
jgi:proteasome lid subunit RPN8/RPN11